MTVPPWWRGASGLGVLLLLGIAFAQEPIRVNVRLVRVLATVKDASGALVGSLEKGDFAIRDNGVAQDVAVFERRTEQPLSVALLIDNSGSTAIDLKYEVTSITRFAQAIFREGNLDDMVALYSFNWEVVRQHDFTRNVASIERPLRNMKGEAGTSLYDAIYLVAGELQHRQGRRVMVIVTDGGDTVSNKDFHAALEATQLADASIYPILVVPIENGAGRNSGGENALTSLAQYTGGRVFLPTLGAQMDAAFDQIIRELRTQYYLAYYPKGIPLTKDRFHRLQIQVRQPGLQVLARTGYYGDWQRDANGEDHISVDPRSAPPATKPSRSR